MKLPQPQPRGGLSRRLLIAQAVLLVAGAGTSWLVASIVGPEIFHNHILRAAPAHRESELVHIEMAFRDSLLIAMGVALLVSVITAFLVTAWFTRRVQRSTGAMVTAAGRITAGRYDVRVPTTGLGSELDDVAGTINELAQRLDEVETTRRRLLSDLGHEMRTPLATIDMHLEAIEDGVRALDADTLEVLRLSTGRLRRLAEDVSTVSRAQEGQLELEPSAGDLAEVAAASATLLQDAFYTKGVALVVRAGPAVPFIGDRQRLGQVATNLITNALRHTPQGGTVTISAFVSPDGGAALEVRDDGEGIGADHLRHISNASTAGTLRGRRTTAAPVSASPFAAPSLMPMLATSRPPAAARVWAQPCWSRFPAERRVRRGRSAATNGHGPWLGMKVSRRADAIVT